MATLEQSISNASSVIDPANLASNALSEDSLVDGHCEESFQHIAKDRLAVDREAKIKAFFEMIAGEHAAGNFSMF